MQIKEFKKIYFPDTTASNTVLFAFYFEYTQKITSFLVFHPNPRVWRSRPTTNISCSQNPLFVCGAQSQT